MAGPTAAKRVLAEVGWGSKYHALEIGHFRVLGPNPEGHFAVDLEFPCPGSVTSLKAYILHLSAAHLDRLRPVEDKPYEFAYEGVLNSDHPFTSSFTDQKDVRQSGGGGA